MNPSEINKKLKNETLNSIKSLLEESDGIQSNNLDYISKLVDIQKDLNEIEGGNNMNYGNYNGYGNYSGYGNYENRGGYNGSYGRDNYGREQYGNSYGIRGYDSKYRGYDELDKMYNEYGRYSESRERYGAGEDTDKSFHYMVKALEDFIKVLYEEADSPQQKQMLQETIQKSMM